MDKDKIRSWFDHAFACGGGPEELQEADRAILARVSEQVVKRRLATPAILFLESMKPLNFVGSQVMQFLKPFLSLVFSEIDISHLAAALEKRSSVPFLVDILEQQAAARETAPGPSAPAVKGESACPKSSMSSSPPTAAAPPPRPSS